MDANGQEKMLILGDMRELGDVSEEEHKKIVDFIEEIGMSHVWLVGNEFGKIRCNFRKFEDVEQVKDELQQNRPEGRLILIKGSNSTRLHELPPLL
jgi:UDP-N-acetylmuramoyl-tripeptide--D-alanyl-D-alanine ligase